MARVGLWTNAAGLFISIVGTLLLFLHVTSKYHSAIQDIGSIAVGYLGLIVLGVSVSITGVALLLRESAD
jgi:predicted phage tail protein